MKNLLKNFLLANFFWTLLFVWFSQNIYAWNAFDLKKTEVIKSDNLNDRVIDKKISGTKIQNSSVMSQIVPKLFKLMFYLATSLAVLSLIYWWYLMITSLWEDWRHQKWWKVFWWSIIWLFLMLFSRAIVWVVSNIKIASDSVNSVDYQLWNSSYIWNLPSWNIETDIIPQIIKLALQFIFVVIVWIIIYAWIMYITQWEEEKWNMKNLFINAVIWLIIILTSYVLVAWIMKINFW